MTQPLNLEDSLLHVIKLLKEPHHHGLHVYLEEFQPYDIAEIYRNLPTKHRAKFVTSLEAELLADLIQELEYEQQLNIFLLLGIERASKIMDIMENDDLADLLNELSNDQTEQFLGSMEAEESKNVKDLMQYPRETAGGIMTNRFVWIRENYSVREAVDKLKAFAEYAENIYYLYVLNDQKQLVGVVSYRDLLLADINETIHNIMYSRVISVPDDMDQEEVARTIGRYDFIAVPVIDNEQKLVGIVTVDDIIDVIVIEANEDVEKLSATGKNSIDFTTNALTASLRRLPWLILLLFLGLLSGSVIASYEATLDKVVALAFFMPMIAGMTGNTGTQSLGIVIRGIASQHMDRKTIFNLVWRDIGVGLILGLVCGILIAAITFVWQGNFILSVITGVSLLLTLIIGTLAGTMIPLLLFKLKIDPAIASGPLITTLNDIFSLTVYFGLATIFIQYII
ncbi:magnesium transporter [Longirhabdus pacifica]|uniref:magnesium transporter n=1 Tax=Longirhabdus pacifica TaxID=2305227 RepID=UPI001008F529|nr:magnesium transporter [Longirhabdus pacifica]